MRVFTKTLFIAVLMMGSSLKSNCQLLITDTAGMVKYDYDYQFKEGIYLTFDDFMRNSAINPSRIVVDMSVDNPKFWPYVFSRRKSSAYILKRANWISGTDFRNEPNNWDQNYPHYNEYKFCKCSDTIAFITDSFTLQLIAISNLWGYNDGENTYLMNCRDFNNNLRNKLLFHEVGLFGRFGLASETGWTVTEYQYSGSQVGSGTSSFRTMKAKNPSNIQKVIIDFDNGILYPFELQTMEYFANFDIEIAKSYKKMKGSDENRIMFLMGQINRKYPIYFPKKVDN